LFGFNVGLEVGQIAVVVTILLVVTILVTLFKVNRRDWVIFSAGGVLAVALKMALERLPW
jgi:hypothetical protein